MRIAIIAASALLLAALVPIGPGMAKLQQDKEWVNGTIPVDQDVYTHIGWWEARSFQDVNGDDKGTVLDLDEDLRNTTTPAQDPEWIWLKSLSNDRAKWNIEVEARGPVVTAIDVFEVRDNNDPTDFTTPTCVHHLVTDLYPEDGENTASYVARLLHLTIGQHQVLAPGNDAVGEDKTTITLNPDDVPHGYILSIYPLAASNHADVTGNYGEVSSEYQEPEIFYNITATVGKLTLDDNGNQAQPSLPISLGPIISNLNDCTSPGGLPGAPPLPSLGPGEAPELPTGVDDLLNGYLPE